MKDRTHRQDNEMASLYSWSMKHCPGVNSTVDLQKSHARKFQPEAGGIRCPFNSIAGLGDTAAENIMRAREEADIFSVEDLKEAARLSNSVIEMLEPNGVLRGMSKTNQLSFFDYNRILSSLPIYATEKFIIIVVCSVAPRRLPFGKLPPRVDCEVSVFAFSTHRRLRAPPSPKGRHETGKS